MREQTEPRARQHTAEFKRGAVAQMAGCKNISRLAEGLGVRRKLLYQWREQLEARGAEAFERAPAKGEQAKPTETARPDEAATAEAVALAAMQNKVAKQQERIAQLERQLGQKQLEVDFLEQTFAHVRGVMKRAEEGGATPSTEASRRNSRAKENG